MPHPISIPKGSAPARRAALPPAHRDTAALTLAIAVFFGASMVTIHRVTEAPAPVASPPPVPDATPRIALPTPPAAPPSAMAPAPSRSEPAPEPVAAPSFPSVAEPVSTARASRVEVSFKLDPRLTKGLGMGDRWVSRPTYASAAIAGTDATIEARAEARDSTGSAMKSVTPVWTPADPEMVAVSPGERGTVRITVKRAGRSDVRVTSGGAEQKLTVAAVQERGVWRVDITQR